MSGPERHPLDELPPGSFLRSVTAQPALAASRHALRVELTDEITAHGTPGVDYVDMPTLAVLPITFRTGRIQVDVLSRLNGKTDFDSRAFAGIAFGIDDPAKGFEAVYLRPLNGLKTHPEPPRDRRAVQYFAYPDWKFDRLRDEYPDGRYEAGADIAPDEWNTLTVTVAEHEILAEVNGDQVLRVVERKHTTQTGNIGLFVDIGSEAYFADLLVEHRADIDTSKDYRLFPDEGVDHAGASVPW